MRFMVGLRTQLLALVGAALAPVMLLDVVEAHEQADRELEATGEQADHWLRLASDEVRTSLDETRGLTSLLARAPELRGADPAPAASLFADILVRHPIYSNFALLDREGTVVANGVPAKGTLSYADLGSFRQALASKAFTVGGFWVGRSTGNPVLTMAQPVFDEAGGVRAVLHASFRLDALARRVAALGLPERAAILIVDSDGVVLVRHPEVPGAVGRKADDVPAVAAIRNPDRRGRVRAAGLDGVERVYAYEPLTVGGSPTRVSLSAGFPTAPAEAAAGAWLARRLSRLGGVALAAALLAWLAGGLLVSRGVRPLLDATGRLASGDFTARVGRARGARELQELGTRFDSMADSLRTSYAAIEASESRFREIARTIDDVFFVADPTTGAIVYLSPAFARVVGYGVRDVTEGRTSWLDVMIHADDRSRVAAFYRSSMEGVPSEVAYRFVRRDGAVRHGWTRTYPVRDAAGHLVRVIGLIEDVTDDVDRTQALRDTQGRYEALARRLQDLREEEQGRIAREIHDEFGQVLTALRLHLAALRDRMAPPHSDVTARLDRLVDVVDDAFRVVRRIATELRPPELDHLGLATAIRNHLAEFRARTAIEATADVDIEAPPPHPPTALCAFRIAQEALTNVARHSGAKRAHVRLWREGEWLHVEVADEGRGIDPAAIGKRSGLGLLGMAERARAIGGTVEVARGVASGTVVRARLPWQPAPGNGGAA